MTTTHQIAATPVIAGFLAHGGSVGCNAPNLLLDYPGASASGAFLPGVA
jgi:hypothetical protein